MQTPEEKYLLEHTTPQSEALNWLQRQTNIRTNYPRMLSGAVQGRLLTMLVKMTGARNILEIGCF
ncbi:MAG: methyltransferase, partial [Bacteroidales bacterium]|nr:methyltransferase [Bacteroidales bacterium]